MTKKTMVIILIFVILAGAIAGTFIFLNQAGTYYPTALPSVSSDMGGMAADQGTLPFSDTFGTGRTVPALGVSLSV